MTALYPIRTPGRGKSTREPRPRAAPSPLEVSDCRAAYDELRGRGVEFTQEPVERYGSWDAGFRDPSGNGWKMIQSRR